MKLQNSYFIMNMGNIKLRIQLMKEYIFTLPMMFKKKKNIYIGMNAK